MTSRIEEIILQMERYLESCKFQAFSSTKLIVDRNTLYGFLDDMRDNMPVEIAHYRQIIESKQEILDDARKKADALIDEATIQTNELINEHAIMQQAYAQANQVMALSSQQAEEVLKQANAEASAYRESAVSYVADLLDNLEAMSVRTLADANDSHAVLAGSLEQYIATLRQNKEALVKESLVAEEGEEEAAEEEGGESGAGAMELKLI